MRRLTRFITALSFAVIVLTSCAEDTEIFDNAEDLIEQATDEEDEKKQKPGG